MFNCDMVLYYLRNYITLKNLPEQMIDPNTRTDYNKMKKLIQLDRLDGDRKGYCVKSLMKDKSLLIWQSLFLQQRLPIRKSSQSAFYYGMLTITDTRGGVWY